MSSRSFLTPTLLSLFVLGLASSPAPAETFFLVGGQAVVGELVNADEAGVQLKLQDGTVIEIPGGDLQPLSFYRALRTRRDLEKGSDRLYLGDRCLALGLTDLALSEYEAAAAKDPDLAEEAAGKRSLARSVLAYDAFNAAVRQFDSGSLLTARMSFQKFVETFEDVDHLVEAARQYMRECETDLAARNEEDPAEELALRKRMEGVDRKMKRIEELIDSSRKAVREVLLAADVSLKSRQGLLRAASRSKRALEAARELNTMVRELPLAVVHEAKGLLDRATESLIDAYLKLAHLHLLANDYGGAKDYVDRILRLDPKSTSARSLLRLIQARAKEANPEEGPLEVTRIYRKRAAIKNGFRGTRGPGNTGGAGVVRTSPPGGPGPKAPVPRGPAPGPRKPR